MTDNHHVFDILFNAAQKALNATEDKYIAGDGLAAMESADALRILVTQLMDQCEKLVLDQLDVARGAKV